MAGHKLPMSDDLRASLPPRITMAARTEPRPLPEGYVIDGFSALPGETIEGYNSYLAYRDLGPGRTVTEAARKIDKSAPMLMVRSHRERWKERVAQFDRAVAEEERLAMRAAFEEHANRMAQRRMEIQEQEFQDYLAIHKKTEVMLQWPTFIQEVSRDGKIIKYIPYKWSATSLAQLLEQASILARRSTEMPTTYQQVDINANTSQEISTAHMTPEEKAAHEYAERVAAEVYLAAVEQYRGADRGGSVDHPSGAGQNPLPSSLLPEKIMARSVEVPADIESPPDWYVASGGGGSAVQGDADAQPDDPLHLEERP
jgi:hypothetical protein